MMFEAGGDVFCDGSFAAQDIDARGGEEDFVREPLDRKRWPAISAPLGEPLGFEDGDDLVFQSQFRVHKKERQVGD